MKKRVAIVGAGLCGSVLAARLRDAFSVTVIEQARTKRPLFHEISCDAGGMSTTINRAAGLGGTTSYWHNALIELSDNELRSCGLDPLAFAPFYERAWSLFMPADELATSRRVRDTNNGALQGRPGQPAHMVVPHARVNAWGHADRAYPGDPVAVTIGRATRLTLGPTGRPQHINIDTASGQAVVEADHYVLAGGGLGTPVLLANSLGLDETMCGGYHDHPMAYVAKVRLKSSSALKKISCEDTGSTSIRTGFVYESDGLSAVFYLRPALTLDLKSITGEARYLLSDLRNDPFSPKKILQLMGNIEALREAVLFKMKAGFSGDYYSILMLGEQAPSDARGISLSHGRTPVLNWSVTPREHAAYHECFKQFLADMADEIVAANVVPADHWDYRTANHHSGAAARFMAIADGSSSRLFDVARLPNTSICDASLLRRGGIANSGLTLVALAHQLADALIAEPG